MKSKCHKAKRKGQKPRLNTNPVKRESALSRYRKILTQLLKDNCSSYSWTPFLFSSLRNKDWEAVYNWAAAATTEVYGDPREHYAVQQIAALVLKFPHAWKDLGLPESPEDAAKRTFVRAEKLCKVANKRFRSLRNRKTSYRPQLEYMRSWIHRLLGATPDLVSIYSQCSFSSGSAIGVHGNATNLFRKLHAESWSVNPNARDYALHALCSNEQFMCSFAEKHGDYVCFDRDAIIERMKSKCVEKSFNKVSFVPKTVKTHRVIAVEPLLNSYIQTGIDSDLRRKLKSRGYDLTDQNKNKYLARLGSTYGKLSTMDLSMASDTISIELVRYLLPTDWFDLLNRTRSGTFKIDGVQSRYEKFASMGNGFCFPLETLIFVAATRAAIWQTDCDDKTHNVYGDDIIVPTPAFSNLSKLLAYCGFKVNPDKSFCTGPFRESCGADWYEGQDVRPVYLKYHLTDDCRLMIFHNATYRSQRSEAFFEGVRSMVREWVPFRQRMCRPYWAQPVIQSDFSWIEIMAANGAFSVEQDLFMGSHFAFWSIDIQNWGWKELQTQPRPDKPAEDEKDRFHETQYLSLLQGDRKSVV